MVIIAIHLACCYVDMSASEEKQLGIIGVLLPQLSCLSRSSLLRFGASDSLYKAGNLAQVKGCIFDNRHTCSEMGWITNWLNPVDPMSLTSRLISQMRGKFNLSHLRVMSPRMNVFWCGRRASHNLTCLPERQRIINTSANSHSDGHALQTCDLLPITHANNNRRSQILTKAKVEPFI